MLGMSSLKTIQPIAFGVVSCSALSHPITQPSLTSFSPKHAAASRLEPQHRTSGSEHA
jgi:hypothetical protein